MQDPSVTPVSVHYLSLRTLFAAVKGLYWNKDDTNVRLPGWEKVFRHAHTHTHTSVRAHTHTDVIEVDCQEESELRNVWVWNNSVRNSASS